MIESESSEREEKGRFKSGWKQTEEEEEEENDDERHNNLSRS